MHSTSSFSTSSPTSAIGASSGATWQQAGVGIAIISLEGRLLFANDALASLMRQKPEQLLGRMWEDFVDQSQFESHERVRERMIKSGQMRNRSCKRWIQADGKELWLTLDTTLILDPESGERSHFLSVIYDVTAQKIAERRSRLLEARFQTLFKSDAVGLFYFNLDGSIHEANDAFHKMLGYSSGDFTRESSLRLTPEDWIAQETAQLQALKEGSGTVSYVKELYHRTGRRVPVCIGATLLDPDDEFDGIGVVLNMSELFEARYEAEEYRTRASLALEAANIGIWEWDARENRLIWDARCKNMFGLKTADKESVELFLNLVHPDDRGAINVALGKLMKPSLSGTQAIEFRVCLPTGEKIYAATGRSLRGPDGSPLRALGTMVDITETKIAEQKIFESEERFRTLAEAIPQIVWMCDGGGDLLYFNKKWYEYTGLEDVPSKIGDAVLVSHPDDRENAYGSWMKSLSTGRPFKYEGRLRSADGDYRWFIMRALPLSDSSGRVLRWFGTATDIDEHKKLEEEMRLAKEAAERADSMKTSFLANMSHEIRTPLGAILGFTELLADESLGENEKREFLQVVARNGRMLSRIVDDILDLSKVEAGLLRIEPSRVAPLPLINDAIALFTERARSKSLWLDLRVVDRLPDHVFTDSMRVRQILVNLISNAIKFTERGGVYVEIRTDPAQGAQAVSGLERELVISVRDTGIGISQEQIRRLFQPFAQADESMSRRFGGTGLGLHLSRRLAEAMGGRLEIDCSEPGQGSCFSLRLPFNEEYPSVGPSHKRVAEAHLTTAEPDHSLKGTKILVVEDSEDNRLLIERLLGKKGVEVQFAENGERGVQKALDNSFDLILMDLQMPDVDGFEATERLRAKGLRVPIVALTAHVIEDVRDRCKRVGCDGFLSKPIHAPELLKVIRERLTH